MKFKAILPFLLSVIIPIAPAHSQALKTIPSPYKWEDDNTLLLSERRGAVTVYQRYSAETGERSEITLPEREEENLIKKYLGNGGKNHTLSPDKKWVAFTRDNDLYTINTENGQEIRHTFNGSDLILNGYASWVYYEEIFGRSGNYRAFWWSPDSRSLLYYSFDQSEVPVFPIVDFSEKHCMVDQTRYPKAGDKNPEVKIFITLPQGGKPVEVETDNKTDQYFGPPFWRVDSKAVFIQRMDRSQENLILLSADVATGRTKEIYREHQDTWTEWIEEYTPGERGLYIVRDKDLWENIYYVDYEGSNETRLSGKEQWGTKLLSLDEQNGRLFYTSRGESSLRNDLYCISWKKDYKSPVVNRLSLGEFNYASVNLSPSKKRFVSMISNISTPPRLVMIDIDLKRGEGKNLRVIDDSMGERSEFEKLVLPEIVEILTPDGFRLPASVRWPVNMDRNKKYPVLFYVYGGPNSSNVMDIWRTPSSTLQLLAGEGIIQVYIDNRSSGHCGKKGMNFVHRQLGKYELKDFILWAEHFMSMPFVDSSRIGITGFSFGGTMTALAVTEGSQYFRYGIAGGGVYDWQLYDSHYTERYMDTPAENPEGYSGSAVINKADYYRGDESNLLMLTHGTGDDNVHLQNTMQLIDALQKSKKYFELMLYPGGLHGYRGYQGEHSVDMDIRFWRRTLLGK